MDCIVSADQSLSYGDYHPLQLLLPCLETYEQKLNTINLKLNESNHHNFVIVMFYYQDFPSTEVLYIIYNNEILNNHKFKMSILVSIKCDTKTHSYVNFPPIVTHKTHNVPINY